MCFSSAGTLDRKSNGSPAHKAFHVFAVYLFNLVALGHRLLMTIWPVYNRLISTHYGDLFETMQARLQIVTTTQVLPHPGHE